MSTGFNQAIILGRLTAPPEQLTTRSGKLFVKATLAVSVRRKNAEGVEEERTSFIPATIFGRQAEVFLKYVQKGNLVQLVGRLDTNEWKTDAGEKRLSISFVVEQLHMLPSESARPKLKTEEKREREPERKEANEPDDIPF
ncbi:MAG: single-stranded DNA-binding protein [Verrucomicrobia bacterium]|nr:single-stranded DNA-binding protein [Verrucomicrobiota bacterium]